MGGLGREEPLPRLSPDNGPSQHGAHCWGHKMLPDATGVLRIGVLNYGGIPSDPKDSKNVELRSFLASHKFDIIGLPELNLHSKNLPACNRLHERTRGWFESIHLAEAYFKDHPTERAFQAGGVTQWVINRASHRVINSGVDALGLGRWTWQVLQGTQNLRLRVVTAYCPVVNKSCPGSVWNQQKTYFDNNDREGCPRKLFLADLLRTVEQWLNKGEQVVVMMDANENVTQGPLQAAFKKLGLQEAVTTVHGIGGPATQQRGSVPIDGIFVPANLLNIRCGYIPAGSDHACVWADLPYEVVFGQTKQPTNRSSARRLKCEDPRVVRKYMSVLSKGLRHYSLCDRAQLLNTEVQTEMTSSQQQEWESIDNLRTRLMLHAEKRCRRLHVGGIEWTPELSRTRLVAKVWTLLLRRSQGKGVDSRFLQRVAAAVDLSHRLRATTEEILAELHLAKAAVREQKAEHVGRRSTWLESLASAQAEAALDMVGTDDESDGAAVLAARKLKQIKQLMAREEQRRSARLIKWANGKLKQNASLSSVIADDGAGGRAEFHSKDDIEKALLVENQLRFNQAAGSPFLTAPLADLFGPIGTTKAAEEVLAGTFECPPDVDPFTAKLLAHMQRPPSVPAVSTELTIEQHLRSWKRARERTSSGPSGVHFGHFMAHTSVDEVATLDGIMANIPYRTGYSPQRWRAGTEVMLQKQPGNINAEKLRAILLFEADFNHNNKRLGRDMMFNAEDCAMIAPEQYGSRKGLSAIDHCVNKRLTFDIMRQLKQPGALCANDMKGCYDRIVHSVASLCMQRLGVSQAPIISMFSTLQNLRHFVRTAYGDSSQYFDAASVHPIAIQGVGQGNGAGPQIWAAVSTVVLNVLRDAGQGGYFSCPISGESFFFVGYAFVDDTDLVVTKAASADDIVADMQTSVTNWEGTLRATGGALEPSKTFWYLVDFKWHQGRWKYKRIAESPASIQVRDPAGQMVTLERLEVTDARRTLGVRLAPDGNNTAELAYLSSEAAKWANNLRSHHLQRNQAWMSLTSTIMAKLSYALPATTLTQRECQKIDSIISGAALPCAGVNRHLPKALVHGPTRFQGLGISSFYTMQGVQAVLRLMRFGVDMDHLTGKLLRSSYETMQLEVGCDGPTLELPFSTFGSLATPCFLTSTWQFLSEYGLKLQSPSPRFVPKRQGDRLLMPEFARKFKGSELTSINLCRLYIRGLWVSDITTGCGRYVDKLAWEGKIHPAKTLPSGWPNQGNPGPADWLCWQAAIRLIFGTNERCAGQVCMLREPLGAWAAGTSAEWWFCPATEQLFRLGEESTTFRKVPGRATRVPIHRFVPAEKQVTIPAHAEVASVYFQGSFVVLEGSAKVDLPTPEVTISTFRMSLDMLSPGYGWALKRLVMTDDGQAVAEAIRQGQCIAVSDGSVKDGFGTASAVVEGLSSLHCIRLDMVVPGVPQDQCSYRSEAAGLFGVVVLINELCRYYGITEGGVTIGCDGLIPLRACFNSSASTNPCLQQFDITAATRRLVRSSPVKWTTHHVPGHQQVRPLDRWATLNESMDLACKAFWIAQRDSLPPIEIAGEPWSLWIEGRKVVSNVRKEIEVYVQGQASARYWNKRLGEGSHDLIDWNATEAAMKSVPRRRQQWITKHSSGFCGTGKMAMQTGQRPTDECPRCTAPEDSAHVWQCQSPQAQDLWAEQLVQLRIWMGREGTDPRLTDIILTRLAAWKSMASFDTATDGGPMLEATLSAQDKIGWRSMLEGRPAKGWASLQDAFFKRQRKRRSGKRWLIAVIRKLWDVAWDLWQQRNEALHGKESSLATRQLDDNITAIFQQGPGQAPAEIRLLFNHTLPSL